MKTTSISRKLLSRVLSLYFILTFVVTCVQIGAEYINTKSHINSELLTLEKTFSGSLTRAVWELNTQQAIDIADGLVAIPMIKGITVTDENNKIIAQLGEANIQATSNEVYTGGFFGLLRMDQGFFGHTFPLIFEFSGRTTKVGKVTLLSSNEVIFNRIEVGIYFLIGNAMVKTAALILLFSLAFNRLLTSPLNELTEQMEQFDIDDPEASKLHIVNYEQNELSVLQSAYNTLIDELVLHKEQLNNAQSEIIEANDKLDEHNILLEQEVARKTSSLSTTMLKMEVQQRELIGQQSQLKGEINRRGQTEKTLTQTNSDLKISIIELNKAKERLLKAEKIATLGSLSAEMAHEVNTPIGVGITSVTYLAELISTLKSTVKNQNLSKRALDEFMENSEESVHIVEKNLDRASEIITNFKHVAVDQLSDKIRLVNIDKYLHEIIKSLQPRLKKTQHNIEINCSASIEVYCHAGALAQIFINLIINSLIHGFEDINQGIININVTMENDIVHFTYSDNGQGVSKELLDNIFDAFYTTKSSSGGSGLGTHIMHSLVTDTLNGTIDAYSEEGEGLRFEIEFANMK